MKYKTTIVLPPEVPLGNITEIVEMIRNVAWPKAIYTDGDLPIPTKIDVQFETNDEEGWRDPWDLREQVEELEANLSSFGNIDIPKPMPVVKPLDLTNEELDSLLWAIRNCSGKRSGVGREGDRRAYPALSDAANKVEAELHYRMTGEPIDTNAPD